MMSLLNFLKTRIDRLPKLRSLILIILNATKLRKKLYRSVITLSQKTPTRIDNSQFMKFSMVSAKAANPPKRILIDISVLTRVNAGGGIQRVQKKFFNESLSQNWENLDISPIYFDGAKYKYFNKSIQTPGNLLVTSGADEELALNPGDIYVSLDLDYLFILTHQNLYSELQNYGVKLYQVVYDLLPINFPEYFPEGISELHEAWLRGVSKFDGLLCISNSVASDLRNWLTSKGIILPKISSFPLGQDVLKDPASAISSIQLKPKEDLKFLMVGTLEPRKGYEEALGAFEVCWSQGKNFSLTIVGAPGWHTEKLISKLRGHEELGKRLFWDEITDDSKLTALYKSSDFLIAASYGEGYGLPLVEASAYNLPIVARDIPVFREVAQERAIFFDAASDNNLLQTLINLPFVAKEFAVEAKPFDAYTWNDSFRDLVALVVGMSTDSSITANG